MDFYFTRNKNFFSRSGINKKDDSSSQPNKENSRAKAEVKHSLPTEKLNLHQIRDMSIHNIRAVLDTYGKCFI